MSWQLYGTLGCHLCEDAEALLAAQGLPVTVIDIADDDALMDRYGTRIPVLRHAVNGAELGWPFDADSLRRFVQAQP